MKLDQRTGHLAVLSLLAITALALFITSPVDGDFWWFDSPRHAMNSVFLRDLLVEGGVFHPIDYARAYYVRYPGINIGFYPPFLYLSSVPFLIAFGVSHAAVQAVVTLYALAAGIFTYSIGCRKMDRVSAAATAVIVMTLPAMALWSRQVQLDVPAVALVLAAAYFLLAHLQTGRVATLFVSVVCLGCAMLTRLQTAYAVPVVLFFLFFHRYPDRPGLKTRIAAVALLIALALPSALLFSYFSRVTGSLATATPGMPRLWSIDNWVWYLRTLPDQLGPVALLFLIFGLAAGVLSIGKRGLSIPMLVVGSLALASWLAFTLVSNKDPRFNLPSLPFLVLFAAFGLHQLEPRLAAAAAAIVALFCVAHAIFISQVPTVTGFKEAAAAAAEIAPPNSNVLISAHRDGNFIFDLRALNVRRDVGVRRADKLFVEMSIMRELGIRDRQLDRKAILEIFDHERIDVVVVQPGYLADQPSMRTFEDLVSSGEYFEPVGRVALSGALRSGEKELIVFRRKPPA